MFIGFKIENRYVTTFDRNRYRIDTKKKYFQIGFTDEKNLIEYSIPDIMLVFDTIITYMCKSLINLH